MNKSVLERVDPVFKKEMVEIALERHKRHGQNISVRRLTKAIRNLSYFPRIKDDLIVAEIKDDRFER